MSDITPPVPHEPTRFTVDAYFALIEAGAIAEYWVVNLRDGNVEVMGDPDPALALYRDTRRVVRGETLEPSSLPGVVLDVAALVPEPPPQDW